MKVKKIHIETVFNPKHKVKATVNGWSIPTNFVSFTSVDLSISKDKLKIKYGKKKDDVLYFPKTLLKELTIEA